MNASLATLRDDRLRRVDAALGAWLARAYPDSTPEAALAAALAARAIADGHSALALDRAQAWFSGLGGGDQAARLPGTCAWRDALRRSPAVHADGVLTSTDVRPLVLDAQGRVYLRRYFEYEQRLANALALRARAATAASRFAVPDFGLSGIDLEQQRAIEIALRNRFTLVTGGPGTGKTYGVVRMLAALVEQAQAQGTRLRIALAAPTGKAAARLAEAVHAQRASLDLSEAVIAQIPDDARTVHRLLEISPWRKAPRFDRASKLPFDVLVVDEVSMVDLPLMAKLVDALNEDARLILLGDPEQLSAVEAGNVLGALVEAARETPLADCHIALTRSRRFDANSPLGALARAVVEGDVDAALGASTRAAEISLADASRMPRFVDAVADAYRPVLAARDPVAALHAARGFRVLSALRRGPCGCIALDRAIAGHLQRTLGLRADQQWWRGRLLLVSANRPELGLSNGDTGVVWTDGGTAKVWFEGSDGAARSFTPAALPPHEGAFALTVHKAQGSEFERVALVTGPDSAVLTRELLYTGVTRARSGIVIYSTPDTLRAGIERRTLRMTGLADRLREAAFAPNSIAETSSLGL